MAGKMYRTEDFKAPLALLSYPNLHEPDPAKTAEKKKDMWTSTFIFPKGTDLAPLTEKIKEVAVQQWGDKGLERLKDGLIKNPLLDGGGKQGKNKTTGEYNAAMGPGVYFVRCATVFQPTVVNARVLPATKEECYPGVECYPVLQAYAWNNKENGDGISFGFSMVQVLGRGERIAGASKDPNEHFEKVDTSEGDDTGSEENEGQGASGLFG